MSLRKGLLGIVDAARSLSGPKFADIRVNQLTIRTRTWSGARIGQGTYTDSDLVLPAQYPIRYLSMQEINTSAGQYETGDVLVDHVTPSNGKGVGYTNEQLQPTVTTNNVEVIYILAGDHPGEYSIVEFRTLRPFTIQMVLRRRTTTP